jgi:DHA1 family bicyclomycin/chloramphenicol resistance-like MFS transporter
MKDGPHIMTTESTALDGALDTPAPAGWKVLAVLSSLMGFASISTDFYLPAMPAIERSLAAAPGMIELTISSYLIGFSLGQLLWGPIGDRFGRRLPVAAGLVLFIIGSAGCAFAGDATMMIIWRVVQAVGACAGVVLARAMVRDLYAGDRAAQMLSTLMTVMAIAPLVGPLLGAQIMLIAGWEAIFWTLVAIGAATLLALMTLPETLPENRRNREPLGKALLQYGALLKDRRLVAFAFAGGFFYAGMYAYIAATPFAYITFYHVPAGLYGLLFGTGIVGIMISNIVNSRLVTRFGAQRLLRFGSVMAAVSALVLAIAATTGIGGLWGLVVPLFFYITSAGFIIANSIGAALSNYPERAGAVSALAGAVHYGSGIVGSALVGVLANGTVAPMGLVIAVAGVGCAFCGIAANSIRQPR